MTSYQKYRESEELKSMAGIVIGFFILGFFLSWARTYVNMPGRNARFAGVLEQARAEEFALIRRKD